MVFNMSGTPTVCSPHTHKLTYLHTYLHTYHHRPSITLILPLPFSLSLLSLSLKKLVTCGVIRSFNFINDNNWGLMDFGEPFIHINPWILPWSTGCFPRLCDLFVTLRKSSGEDVAEGTNRNGDRWRSMASLGSDLTVTEPYNLWQTNITIESHIFLWVNQL